MQKHDDNAGMPCTIGLRRRHCVPLTACSLGLDNLDIRLPRQTKPFTKQDIDGFTFAARLRTLKLLSGGIALFLLLDIINKFSVTVSSNPSLSMQQHLSVFLGPVAIQMGLCFCLFLLHVYLRKAGHKLTHVQVGHLAVVVYLLGLLVYVPYTLTFASHIEKAQTMLESCPSSSNDLLNQAVCVKEYAKQMKSASCMHQFHELMAFAVSCALVALMPLPSLLVAISQLGSTLVLVVSYAYWDISQPVESVGHALASYSQWGVLALCPRVLLSFGVVVFAMHQERLLQIIMAQDEEVAEEGQKIWSLGLVGGFAFSHSNVTTKKDFANGDIENPGSSSFSCDAIPSLFVRPQTAHEWEASSESCCSLYSMLSVEDGTNVLSDDATSPLDATACQPTQNDARLHSPRSCQTSSVDDAQFQNEVSFDNAEIEVEVYPELGLVDSGIITPEEVHLSASFKAPPESPRPSNVSAAAFDESQGTDSVNLTSSDSSHHAWKVHNTFLEVLDCPSEMLQPECVYGSWTDERADVTYTTYPDLILKSSSQSKKLSSSEVPDPEDCSSDEFPESCGASSGSEESMKVLIAPEVKGANSSAVISLREIAQIPRHPVTGELLSYGSIEHAKGEHCNKPCEWLQRGRSCKFHWRCPFCHIVTDHRTYIRQRNRGRSEKPENAMSSNASCCSFASK